MKNEQYEQIKHSATDLGHCIFTRSVPIGCGLMFGMHDLPF